MVNYKTLHLKHHIVSVKFCPPTGQITFWPAPLKIEISKLFYENTKLRSVLQLWWRRSSTLLATIVSLIQCSGNSSHNFSRPSIDSLSTVQKLTLITKLSHHDFPAVKVIWFNISCNEPESLGVEPGRTRTNMLALPRKFAKVLSMEAKCSSSTLSSSPYPGVSTIYRKQ